MGLKVLQLSDCHLSSNPEKPYRGENADANFAAVWASARAWGPDILLLTGDLSEDASAASYQRLASWLPDDLPCLALPGNHDHPTTMARWFPQGPWGEPLAYEAGDWLLVMMHSAKPGRIEGAFSDEEIDGLRKILASSQQPHVLIALHHQPVPVQAPWIDRYPLANPQAFLDVVDGEPRVRCVIWGHIHHHFVAERNAGKNRVLMLGAPSTAANSLARSQRFEADPAGPAARTLELQDSGAVVYGQVYASTD